MTRLRESYDQPRLYDEWPYFGADIVWTGGRAEPRIAGLIHLARLGGPL